MVIKSAETGRNQPDIPIAPELPAKIAGGRLASGLYLVATPIGAARDITLRALDVLNTASVLAAEDTRRLRQLLTLHGIALRGRRIIAHHDHNEAASGQLLIEAIANGESVAYASDAGTPLVSDPGYRLGVLAREAGLAVHALPGPSAVLAALMVAGLPSDRFLFAGFPPQPKSARKTWLSGWDDVDATVILFESPRRVKETLRILSEDHPERVVVIVRELTKHFEERLAGTAAELAESLPEEGLKGEVVILLDRITRTVPDEAEIRQKLAQYMAQGESVRDAAAKISTEWSLPRRQIYQIGLAMGKGE